MIRLQEQLLQMTSLRKLTLTAGRWGDNDFDISLLEQYHPNAENLSIKILAAVCPARELLSIITSNLMDVVEIDNIRGSWVRCTPNIFVLCNLFLVTT